MRDLSSAIVMSWTSWCNYLSLNDGLVLSEVVETPLSMSKVMSSSHHFSDKKNYLNLNTCQVSEGFFSFYIELSILIIINFFVNLFGSLGRSSQLF